jgi:type II secretory pathway component PulM
MTDPRRPRWYSNPAGRETEPTRPLGAPYQPSTSPTGANQPPYAPGYGPAHGPNLTESRPTERLPQYWLQGQPHDADGIPPGDGPPLERPRSPRWLWIVAGAAVLLVVALVIALVIANSSAKNETVVPPLPAMPGSSTPVSKSASSATSAPSSTTSPTSTSGATTSAAAAQTVVYSVTGQGHAISITYVDDGGVRQTEFNVVLPWTKEVSLSSSQDTANVTIVNIGHDVTCSVTVGGVQVRQRTGVGLTVCDAAG